MQCNLLPLVRPPVSVDCPLPAACKPTRQRSRIDTAAAADAWDYRSGSGDMERITARVLQLPVPLDPWRPQPGELSRVRHGTAATKADNAAPPRTPCIPDSAASTTSARRDRRRPALRQRSRPHSAERTARESSRPPLGTAFLADYRGRTLAPARGNTRPGRLRSGS